jgi:dephospho-CoA kinase
MKRNKESDPKNLVDFIIADNRDFGEEDLSGQQVAACMNMADYHILNDFTLEEFNKRIEEIYVKLKRKVHK